MLSPVCRRYFSTNRTGSEVTQQRGVFRVNCIDCLDRTNVVQSLLARRSLHSQLVRLGILQDVETLEDQATFNYLLRNGTSLTDHRSGTDPGVAFDADVINS